MWSLDAVEMKNERLTVEKVLAYLLYQHTHDS